MCDISPASMAGIMQGDFMVLDLGTGSQEVVVAAHVSVDHFSAYCRFSHGAGAPLQKSSLANLQVKLGNNQVTTVQAVLSATSIQMDRPFGGPAIPNSLYQIYMAYARISNTAYRLLDAGDTVQGARLGTDKTVDWLNIYDPQRTTSGDLQELVSTVPAAGGVMQWELWPGQLSAVVIQVMYVDGWPKLKSNGDMSPYFLNEEIFVALSTADALNTKFIPSASRATVDPYYDPMAAKRFEMQGREYLEDAIQQDQGRYMTMLTNYAQQLHGVGIGNVAYEAAHVPWPSDLD